MDFIFPTWSFAWTLFPHHLLFFLLHSPYLWSDE
jgi:hypothetical protein